MLEPDAKSEAVPSELFTRARAGDESAFRALTEPHRRELRVHCYRLLGSFHDAEDALQDCLLAAWQGLAGFEERASLRTWLYRIATNHCLNVRRSAKRRPARAWNIPGVDPPEPTRLGEVVWLEPFPDALLDAHLEAPPGPDVILERGETISLAFITALQLLPPRQVAVLVLRDVLGFRALDVADMLGATLESANSMLKRARAGLRGRIPERADRLAEPLPGSETEGALVAKFVAAYEAADVEAVVALLTDDVFISMPPMPFEYQGRALVGRFCAQIFGAGRRFDLVVTRANGAPAVGTYLRDPSGVSHGVGLFALTLEGNSIRSMTRFEASVLPAFGLPSVLRPS